MRHGDKILAMVSVLRHLIGWLAGLLRSREDLLLENLALRQQLLALHSRRPRPRLSTAHKLFWVILRRLWSGWKRPLVLVKPRTVVAWHRAGFRLYWKWLSRAKRVGGRKRVSQEIRALIFRMAAENPTWGAPRIHGELLKLGFCISEPTVSRWLRRAPRNPDPAKPWLRFLRNHRDAIAAIDFFTVPTFTFGVLYCFFVIGHDRRLALAEMENLKNWFPSRGSLSSATDFLGLRDLLCFHLKSPFDQLIFDITDGTEMGSDV